MSIATDFTRRPGNAILQNGGLRGADPEIGAPRELLVAERRADLARRQRWVPVRNWAREHSFELTVLAGYAVLIAVMVTFMARLLEKFPK